MRITCPNCTASFELPTELLGKKGRALKCASCGHSWYQSAQVEDLDLAAIMGADYAQSAAAAAGAAQMRNQAAAGAQRAPGAAPGRAQAAPGSPRVQGAAPGAPRAPGPQAATAPLGVGGPGGPATQALPAGAVSIMSRNSRGQNPVPQQ